MLEGVPLFAGAGMLITTLGIPLWLRKVRPNHLYGVRTVRTLADEETWYEVNASCGRDMIIVGLSTLALALALPAAGFRGSDYSLAMALFLILGGAGVSIAGLVRARNADLRQ